MVFDFKNRTNTNCARKYYESKKETAQCHVNILKRRLASHDKIELESIKKVNKKH